MNAQQSFDNMEELFNEAGETFRKGVGTLSNWSDQARDLIESKPGVILAAIGVSGFVTGSLFRHGFSTRRSARAGENVATNTLPGFTEQKLPADPFVLFLAGIVAGVVAGPKVIQEALTRLDSYAQGGASSSGDNIIGLEGSRGRAGSHGASHHSSHSPMDERPFEKI